MEALVLYITTAVDVVVPKVSFHLAKPSRFFFSELTCGSCLDFRAHIPTLLMCV